MTATLADALEEIARSARNTQRLAETGKLTPPVAERKLAALARAAKAIAFLIANEDWILAIHQSRERMRREAEILCAGDPRLREVMEAFEGAEVVDVRPLQPTADQDHAT